MSDFKFSCPHCDQHLQCNVMMSGRQIQCPSCHHLIVIPPSPEHVAGGNWQAESGKTWQTFVPMKPASPPKPGEVPPAS